MRKVISFFCSNAWTLKSLQTNNCRKLSNHDFSECVSKTALYSLLLPWFRRSSRWENSTGCFWTKWGSTARLVHIGTCCNRPVFNASTSTSDGGNSYAYGNVSPFCSALNVNHANYVSYVSYASNGWWCEFLCRNLNTQCCQYWTDLNTQCCQYWTDLNTQCCQYWTDLNTQCCQYWTDLNTPCCQYWTDLNTQCCQYWTVNICFCLYNGSQAMHFVATPSFMTDDYQETGILALCASVNLEWQW